MMKKLLKILITLIAVAVATYATWRFYQEYEEHPWTRDGQVRAYVVGIAARVDGPMVAVNVKDNQWVEEGAPLFQIDPTDYEKEVRRAQAALERSKTVAANLKMEVERRRGLVSQELISQEIFQDYEAKYLEAVADIAVDEAELELARLNLSYTKVNAPVSGYITNLEVTVGSYVTTGQPLMALVDADSFWISAYFRETDLHGIKEGDRVRIVMMGDFFEPFPGVVESISWGIFREDGAINQNTQLPMVKPTVDWVRLAQRFPVRIKPLDLPDDIQLRVGQTVSVLIEPIDEKSTPPQAAQPTAGYPKTLTDGRGDRVTVKAQPKRVISLAPSTTQWMRRMGLESALIGVTEHCEVSDEQAGIQRYPVYPSPNFESVLGANADLIITADIAKDSDVQRLRNLGQTVLVLNNDGYDGILRDGQTLAEAMGSEADAQEVLKQLQADREAVLASVQNRNLSPKALIALSPKLDYVAGPGSYPDSLLGLAGAQNVAADAGSLWPLLNRESVVQADPDVIIIAQDLSDGEEAVRLRVLDTLSEEPVWQNLRAVKTGRVVVVDSQLMNVPGPRIGEALQAVHAAVGEN